jgi:probable HAF family extracellular repeat protein
MNRLVRLLAPAILTLIAAAGPALAALPQVSADSGSAAQPGAAALVTLAPPVNERVVITDIGTVNGRSSTGVGINRTGDVAGFSYVTGTIGIPNGPPAEPFLSHATLFSGGVLTDLGTADAGQTTCSPLGCQSLGLDLNDSRWVVGWNEGDYGLMPSLWLPEAVPGGVQGWNLLPPLSREHGSVAQAINTPGQIVGRSSPDGIAPRAVLWELGPSGPAVTDLGTLRTDGGGSASAYDINDSGQIVGAAADDAYYQHGFLYLPEPAYGLPAGMNDLMPGVEDYSTAVGINNRGEIAGGIDLGVPWVWLPEPAYGLPAGVSILKMTGKIVAFFPSAISDAGQIVGQAYVLLNPRTREYKAVAAAWRNGRWIFLDDLLPSRSPWELLYADGIARDGRKTLITGGGYISGITDVNGFDPAYHGYVLAVSCSADFNDDGRVDAADQRILMDHFGQQVTPGTDGDLNGDGAVNALDLKLFAAEVSKPCL